MGAELRLIAGNLQLSLSPSVGAAISAFDWFDEGAAQPILRKCHSPLEKVLDAGSLPLVPFVDRVRSGRFTFRKREVRLQPNMAGDPVPLHSHAARTSIKAAAAGAVATIYQS
jgi:aldose 1-epimerase